MQDDLDSSPFIVFAIAHTHLALPLQAVVRVMQFSPGSNSDLAQMGLVQVGRHLIKVIDLHQWLEPNREASKNAAEPPAHSGFLVVMPSPTGELYGILVHEPPNLLKFPLHLLQPLPQSDRQFTLLDVVSHTATVEHENSTTAIFLLNLQRLLGSNSETILTKNRSVA